MIGMQRPTSLQRCVETALSGNFPGDLIECGVWRGGASILMRAALAVCGTLGQVTGCSAAPQAEIVGAVGLIYAA